MKKVIVLLLACLFSISLLASCSAKNTSYLSEKDTATNEMSYDYGFAASSSAGGGTSAPAEAPMMPPEPKPEMELYEQGEYSGDAALAITPVTPQGGDGFSEKIIYSVYADIESVDFDKTIELVYEMLDKYGAFIENSYVGGKNYNQAYYGYQSYRSANFTIRIPKDRLQNVSEELNALGNVTSLRNEAQNITAQFVDTESRLAVYRTEETRLLDMLAKADTVADMITIETRLSEVRYNIESYTSTLKNWQNQIDYSTMTLFISEVEKLTDTTPVPRSYWKQLSDGVMQTLKNIGEFFKDLLKFIVVASPVLVIIAVIAAVAAVIIRKKLKKRHTPPGDDTKS